MPTSTKLGLTEKDSPGWNVTLDGAIATGVVDGAVGGDEEHAARPRPRTDGVKSRIMIVPFCDRSDDLELDLTFSLYAKKMDILYLRRTVASVLLGGPLTSSCGYKRRSS